MIVLVFLCFIVVNIYRVAKVSSEKKMYFLNLNLQVAVFDINPINDSFFALNKKEASS